MAVIPQELVPHQPHSPSGKKRRRPRRRGRRHRSDSSASEGSLRSSSCANNSNGEPKRRSRRQQPDPVSEQEQQQYLALDCEMVGVGCGGFQSALARVTLVDWNGQTVYDEYVQPTEPVTDYRTFVSGITADVLEHAMDLQTCRREVQALLWDKILVGHALKNDLHALQIQHPWQQTRDTAKYEPFMKVRDCSNDGVLWPRRLRELCHEKLHWEIQTGMHSPAEDAVAALRLYQLVRPKWEKVMAYKIQKTADMERRQHEQQQHDSRTTSTAAVPPEAGIAISAA